MDFGLGIVVLLVILLMLAGTFIVRLRATVKRFKEEKDETKINLEKEIRQMKKEVAKYMHLNKYK